ncbi:DNA-binding protein [Burkholderia orbicola]|uniref:DNA-binding protein n=1 Tax=Burkholderia orbicola TaxID=2978683 RepID=UPI0035C6A591
MSFSSTSPTMLGLLTEELADQVGCKPRTIHKRYSQTGSYHGVRPIGKLPSRRLLWPVNAAEQLLKKGTDLSLD